MVDNLERALGVAPDGEGDLVGGRPRSYRASWRGELARAGIETIEPKGDKFDPKGTECAFDASAGGCKVRHRARRRSRRATGTGDTVIRPARVVVAA